jgi:hypothetical protein
MQFLFLLIAQWKRGPSVFLKKITLFLAFHTHLRQNTEGPPNSLCSSISQGEFYFLAQYIYKYLYNKKFIITFINQKHKEGYGSIH